MNDEECDRFRIYAKHYPESDVAMFMEHIDSQNKQIATLKAALINERESRIVGSKESSCYPHIGTWKQKDVHSHTEATAQLARELPMIDWGI